MLRIIVLISILPASSLAAHPSLGVVLFDERPINLAGPTGVGVRYVEPGEAASSAGLKAGDIIVAVNDEQTRNFRQLNQILGRVRSKKQCIKMAVARKNDLIEFSCVRIDRSTEKTIDEMLDVADGASPVVEIYGKVVAPGRYWLSGTSVKNVVRASGPMPAVRTVCVRIIGPREKDSNAPSCGAIDEFRNRVFSDHVSLRIYFE